MNYYEEIKNEIINNEVAKKVKDYSKNRNDLRTYYNIGKLLVGAGKCYGEGIIKEYSRKLTAELGKGYTETNLRYFRQFYYFANHHTVCDSLSWSHYRTLLAVLDNEVNYYIKICISNNLSVRELKLKIKNNEYKRLSKETKRKLMTQEKEKPEDLIKNPIIINNKYHYENISEKILQQLIVEDITAFLKELGVGFSFIGNEYKIKVGDRYNYIDLLLYNIKFKCYVVIELKVTELKKEHIGQIGMYMNYIDKNMKSIDEDKTVGIIIVKKENKYVMEYCSDDRIIAKEYKLV